MPRLMRAVARTAVVAGTATAVSNRVSRRQANRWAAQDQQSYAPEQTYAEPSAQGSSADDRLAQLRELGELRASGVLSDSEFEAQKAKILAG
jgi:Short C-terminal domain